MATNGNAQDQDVLAGIERAITGGGSHRRAAMQC